MGAEFDYLEVKGNKKEAESQYEAYCDDMAYENGHSYSGCLNMTTGLKFSYDIFESHDEAYDYVMLNTEKWGNALAVQYRENNELIWFIGAICSS